MVNAGVLQIGDRVIRTGVAGTVIAQTASHVIVRWDTGFPSVSKEHTERLRRPVRV